MIRGHGSAVSLQLIVVGTRHCRVSVYIIPMIVVGTRHCRVLRLYHSDANGIDIVGL